MSPLRITALLVVGLGVAVAACSADGGNANTFEGNDSGTASLPDAAFPTNDSGVISPDDGGDAGTPAVCGNGKKESTEACDDGNKNDGDGCTSTCTLESAFEGDVCPGKTIALTATGQLLTGTVSGSTVGALNHYGTGCGGGSGRDVVYTFTAPSSGKATVTLTASFAAMVAARSTCAESTSESKCADLTTGGGGSTTMEIPVFANTPVFLIVDGYGGTSGTFTLDVSVSQAVCGNGIAELPEACDDGNATNGDGCSSTCTLEAGGILSQCPGQPFTLTGAGNTPRRISFTGNTLTMGARGQEATGCYYQGGPNVIYAVKPDVTGSLSAKLTSGYEKANLHARSDCGSSTYQLGCQPIEAPGLASLTIPVKANEWTFLLVDGHRNGSKDYGGPFTLDVTVTPAVCGNGVLDGNEGCDDGNADVGDGCTASCARESVSDADTCPGHALTLTPAGDGSRSALFSGTTSGLAGNLGPCHNILTSTAPDAIFTVTPDIDGLLEAKVAGPFNSTLSVVSSCVAAPALACSWNAPIESLSQVDLPLVGQGSNPKRVAAAVQANTTYWVVVDAHSSSGTPSAGPYQLDLKVTPAQCGNGVIEGTETCDDGGIDTNDGCDASCQVEPITSRSTCGDAEAITLTEVTPGNWSTSLARGTTNLLANGNFFKNDSTSTADKSEACWAPGRNAFFSLTAPASGVLRATAKSSAFDVVLGIRKPSCALDGPALMCANDSGKGNDETLARPIAAGEQVWIVVDGKVATELGRFVLDVSITPSGCADGFFVPGPNEQCDDGNSANGDGCSSTCTLETKAGVDTCPGTPLTLVNGKGTITFSTATLSADYTGMCGGSAKDGVVKVTAPMNGTLTAKIRGMIGATVYARTTCNDPATELAKATASSCPNVVHDTVKFSVTSGTEYFLFVDGLDGATGVPTLDVSIAL